MARATKCGYSLLLIGKTGNGKSATGNKILNLKWDPFQVGCTDTSVTETCQFDYSRYQEETIKVVDLPGLSDSSKNKADDIKDIEKEATTAVYETPDGYDAVLVVVKFGRQSRDDKETFDSLKGIFGKDIFREYGILVVTHGDLFKEEASHTQTLDEFCSKQEGLLNELWNECNKRVVLFDNKTKCGEEQKAQRKNLFDLVDAMKGKSRYTPDLFKKAKAKRDELIAESEDLVLTDRMKSKLRLMMHDLSDVKLETPGDSITQLEDNITQLDEIKTRAQEFTSETNSMDKKVNKIKAVLAMADSIEKATERKKELASLMMSMTDDEEIESKKNDVEKDETNLLEQYDKLLQADLPTKAIIAAAALLVLGITLPLAAGVVGGVAIGAAAAGGVTGRAALPYVGKGVVYALTAIPFSSLPGAYEVRKVVQKSSLLRKLHSKSDGCSNQ